VRFEAARIARDPLQLVQAFLALRGHLPGALFGISLGAWALFGALLAFGMGTSAVAALRGFGLHGHALGHRIAHKEPPAWPGVLMLLGLLALLALFGVGPVLWLAVAGAIGALRLPRPETLGVALSLALLGAALGPGVDRAAPALVAAGRESVLLGAWRIDRGTALPGDLERVERAHARAPDDPLLRLTLATAWKRDGDLARADALVGETSERAPAELRSAALNLRGIARLAEGNLTEAIPAFERARSASESAAVMFNLSQAYGRALRLNDQEPAFAAARRLDPTLVDRYMAADGGNVHSALIHAPLALRVYLREALAPSSESEALARELRERLLGADESGQLWLALPAAGLFALLVRRKAVKRCSRCERPLCPRCSHEAMAAGTCLRCVRLFIRREHTDPRLRKLQLDVDRRRQRLSRVRLALLSISLPGITDLFESRALRGALGLLALGAGVALWLAPRVLPLPWELGELARLAPLALAALLLAPLYAAGLLGAFQRLASLRKVVE
jgi:tetratricopeptide (TPR) repeat protein